VTRCQSKTSSALNDALVASCDPGEVTTGGGWTFVSGNFDGMSILVNAPSGAPPTGWFVQWENLNGHSNNMVACAVCALP
jgi:hypothetical protein